MGNRLAPIWLQRINRYIDILCAIITVLAELSVRATARCDI